jgi:hypothetical protein
MDIDFLIWLFVGWSVCTTIVNGSIFNPIKNWALVKAPLLADLLSCIMCCSFWVGNIIFIPLTYFDLIPGIISTVPKWNNYIILPFLQIGFSVIVESFLIFLVKRSIKRD